MNSLSQIRGRFYAMMRILLSLLVLRLRKYIAKRETQMTTQVNVSQRYVTSGSGQKWTGLKTRRVAFTTIGRSQQMLNSLEFFFYPLRNKSGMECSCLTIFRNETNSLHRRVANRSWRIDYTTSTQSGRSGFDLQGHAI